MLPPPTVLFTAMATTMITTTCGGKVRSVPTQPCPSSPSRNAPGGCPVPSDPALRTQPHTGPLPRARSRKVGHALRGIAAALLVPLALLAMANSYTRGGIICNDFQNAEERYELHPTEGYAVAYAHCLLA